MDKFDSLLKSRVVTCYNPNMLPIRRLNSSNSSFFVYCLEQFATKFLKPLYTECVRIIKSVLRTLWPKLLKPSPVFVE